MLLRFFIATVIIAAGGYRLLHPTLAKRERQYLQLPHPTYTVAIAVAEVTMGLLLILGVGPWIYWLLIGMMSYGLARLSYYNWSHILATVPDSFILHPTFTDVFLHLTYLVMLVYLATRR